MLIITPLIFAEAHRQPGIIVIAQNYTALYDKDTKYVNPNDTQVNSALQNNMIANVHYTLAFEETTLRSLG